MTVSTSAVTTTASATTTSGVNPAAAAAAGAAAVSKSSDESSSTTQWVWIAFGILAAAVAIGGVVWWNGWARISPVEPEFVDGELMLGMMWRSPKALDLLRDPRVVVHSTLRDRHDLSGDIKLYGRAFAVEDEPRLDAHRRAIRVRIDWEPPEPYHVFAVDIEAAG